MADEQTLFRRGTAAQIAAASPPAAGEMFFNTDTDRLSAGDGVKVGGHILALLDDIRGGEALAADAGGSANAITVTLSPAPLLADIKKFFIVVVKIATTNTAAVTLNVNGHGAVQVVDQDGKALIANSLVANSNQIFVHDGTNWVVIGLKRAAGWETVELITASDDATVEFSTGFEDGFEYELRATDVRPRNNAVALHGRISFDGGATWEFASNSYEYSLAFLDGLVSGWQSGGRSADAAQLLLTDVILSNNSERLGEILIKFANPATVKDHAITWKYAVGLTTGTSFREYAGAGTVDDSGVATAFDGFQLFMSGGNIDGTFVLSRKALS